MSETSISSDQKKKQPKPSIHSSISENISFHSANYMHLKNEVIIFLKYFLKFNFLLSKYYTYTKGNNILLFN